MCGIAGFFDFSNSLPHQSVLNRMLHRIEHRGPDECGLYLDKNFAMGSVRLSIIDLSNGQQPLSNENGNLWIAYNGEVFNYKELRADLIQKGHRFKTQSDTEVIIHLYEEYGVESISMMNGQFAFAIYDASEQSLFLARDRVGIRPLFYASTPEAFLFGSEIKALFEYPNITRKLSPEGVQQIFTFWTTITPNTAFEQVFEVPPGHYATIKNNKIVVSKYWDLNYASNGNRFRGTLQEATEELDLLLNDAVKLRMRADVDVAAYLSGGLDSSATTQIIKHLGHDNLYTFSIGFSENEYDETPYQQEVSKFLNTKHISVKCNNQDIVSWFPKVIWHAETPLLRSAPAPMMGLSQLVRKHNIKVVVTGEGADEALLGYDIFKEAKIRAFWANQPNSQVRPLLLKKLYPYIEQIAHANPSALKMFFGYQLERYNSAVYAHLIRWKNTSRIQQHFSEEWAKRLSVTQFQQEVSDRFEIKGNKYSSMAKAQMVESEMFMSGYLLSAQGDRMAMANSVEGRYPFLDYRLLSFCATLPDRYKMIGLNEKFILKQLMKGKLPESVLKRPKQAYRAPISQAFLNNSAEYIKDLMSVEKIADYGIFNPQSVAQLMFKMKNDKFSSEVDNMAFMAVLSTQLLHYLFVDSFETLSDDIVTKGIVRNI